ncbi:MAG TPA: adenosylcobinamide-phosphate synthase CbiB [Acidimicrobiales bacterium]
MTAVLTRSAAVAAGLAADRLFGEPPAAIHPVALFGKTMQAAEHRLYSNRRSAGAVYAGLGVIGAAALGRIISRPRRAVSRFGSQRVSWTALSAATYVAVAGRALTESASRVADAASQGDLALARARLPELVGRDPSGLGTEEISRAVVESLAENTVDAVVAPAFWGAVAGAPGVLAYRAVNTLDAMVGHRSDRYLRFGWAAARADDFAGWIPARLTAVVVACSRPASVSRVWRAVRLQAPAHPSPNAGVAEAAFAAALGCRLGGVNVYGSRVEERPLLGQGPPASIGDIGRAAALSRDVVALLAALLSGPSIIRVMRASRGRGARGNERKDG